MKTLVLLVLALLLYTSLLFGQSGENENLSLPPVSTFADACARCHGDEGKNYGEGFAKLDDEELNHIVEDMMYGPAYLEPIESDLKAMISYQKAISENEPFIVVTNAKAYLNGTQKTLKVETSLNSKIQKSKSYSVKKGRKSYQYELSSIKGGKIQIVVTQNEKTTKLTFPDQIWSHSK